MALLATAVRVTARCENPECRKTFNQPVALLREGIRGQYCSDPCMIEHAPEHICEVCAGYMDPYRPGRYEQLLDGMRLPICDDCQEVAWRTCWRKRYFPSAEVADQWIQVYKYAARLRGDRSLKKLAPYECPLCDRWHNSGWNPLRPASQDFTDRKARIAEVFTEIGFDIDEARGYTNNPDGTHDIDDDFDLHGGVDAAKRVLQEARLGAA